MEGHYRLAIEIVGGVSWLEDRLTKAKSMLEQFKAGATLQAIGEEYGISRQRVHQIISKLPEYEKDYKLFTRLNERECLQDFSFTEQTPFSAWLVGIIYGDGSISNNNNCISIGMKDIDVIDNINNYFGGGLYTRNHSSAKYININSARLVKELYDMYGLVPNKSDKLIWPKLPIDLYPHFIRGLVDSDGSFSLDGYGWLKFAYRCCSEQFMYDFRDHIGTISMFRKDIKISKTHQFKEHKPLYGFYLGSIHAKRFADYVYSASDSSIRGDRKYQTYTGAIVKDGRVNKFTKIAIKEHYYEWGLTIAELCAVFNLSPNQVLAALDKVGSS